MPKTKFLDQYGLEYEIGYTPQEFLSSFRLSVSSKVAGAILRKRK